MLSMTFVPAFVGTAEARVELSEVETQPTKIEQRGTVLVVTGAMGKTLKVYNLIGMEMMTVHIDQAEKRIDISRLPKGVYPVRVGNVTKKISVNG